MVCANISPGLILTKTMQLRCVFTTPQLLPLYLKRQRLGMYTYRDCFAVAAEMMPPVMFNGHYRQPYMVYLSDKAMLQLPLNHVRCAAVVQHLGG